jgi:hypothetical protein
MTVATAEGAELMTDYQMRTIINLILAILNKSESIEEASKAISALLEKSSD